jgi:single-strand DNA-binding protein
MIRAAVNGRLGADPVSRTIRNGNLMITTAIAVDVNRSGDEPATEWIHLIGFGAVGELLARHRKADVVAVMGAMTRSTFTGRDGNKRTTWSLTVESVVSARTVRPGGRRQASAQPAARRETPGRTIPDDAVTDLWPAGAA